MTSDSSGLLTLPDVLLKLILDFQDHRIVIQCPVNHRPIFDDDGIISFPIVNRRLWTLFCNTASLGTHHRHAVIDNYYNGPLPWPTELWSREKQLNYLLTKRAASSGHLLNSLRIAGARLLDDTFAMSPNDGDNRFTGQWVHAIATLFPEIKRLEWYDILLTPEPEFRLLQWVRDEHCHMCISCSVLFHCLFFFCCRFNLLLVLKSVTMNLPALVSSHDLTTG
jgi:hypothetical protein